MTLQGCAEKCPEDGVPIKNGKVYWEPCKGNNCDVKKVTCDKGYGHGLKPEDGNAQMLFTINTKDSCVIKFTQEPPYCHKCDEGGVTCEEMVGGQVGAVFSGESESDAKPKDEEPVSKPKDEESDGKPAGETPDGTNTETESQPVSDA